MKKILFVFIVLFSIILRVNAGSKFYLGDRIPNFYVETHKGNLSYSNYMHIMTNDSGNITYCINPYLYLNTKVNYNEFTENLPFFDIPDKVLENIKLISYFGYGYSGHTDLKWYGITQYLIWEALGQDDIFFVDAPYGNRLNIYTDEIKEIKNLINNYYILPSFYNNHYEYTTNNTYEIVDTNNVLNNFEILDSELDVSIENNKLKIKTDKTGNYEIKFIKKDINPNNYILYDYPGYQSVIYPGRLNDITFSIGIEVSNGSITINKIDSENSLRREATLKGAVYGIYKNNNLVYTVETNEFGVGYIDSIPFGDYVVKEMIPSNGYNLDLTSYDISISKESKNIVINSYEQVITGNVIINKFYDNLKEDGAIFEIYNNNILIGRYETNNGLIDINLEYGNYYIKQIKGVDGYNFVDDFYISITENRKYEYNLINTKKETIINESNEDDNNLIVEVPNTGKREIHVYKYIIYIGLILLLIGMYNKKTTHVK